MKRFLIIFTSTLFFAIGLHAMNEEALRKIPRDAQGLINFWVQNYYSGELKKHSDYKGSCEFKLEKDIWAKIDGSSENLREHTITLKYENISEFGSRVVNTVVIRLIDVIWRNAIGIAELTYSEYEKMLKGVKSQMGSNK
jgi:hypothetical protein